MKILLVLITLFVGTSIAAAQSATDHRDQLSHAAQRYAEAMRLVDDDPAAARVLFADAAVTFEEARRVRAANAEVLRAQGNAWYFAGDIGRAIVAYQRSLSVDPGDTRTIDALAEARQSVRTTTTQMPGASLIDVLSDWRRYVPPGLVAAVFAISWIAVWGLLVRARLAGVRPSKTMLVAVFAVAGVTATALIGEQWRLAQSMPVVVIDETTGYNGPSDAVYQPSFEFSLSPGVEAHEIESRLGWTHIRLSSEAETWVPSDSLMWIHPRSP